MKMYCQRHRLRFVLTKAITALQPESEINLYLRGEINTHNFPAGVYSYTQLRSFASDSDWKNNKKSETTTKEIIENETEREDFCEQTSSVNKPTCVSNHSTSLTDDEKHLEPGLSVLTDERKLQATALKTVAVVPGKGPPPEPPVTCCMSGCANCVWIMYAEELRDYYKDGGEQAKLALEKIEDPSLRAFVKLELGL